MLRFNLYFCARFTARLFCRGGIWGLGSCAAVGRVDELPPGRYRVLRTSEAALQPYLRPRTPIYLRQATDTLLIAATDSTPDALMQRVALRRGQYTMLLSRRFDLGGVHAAL